MNSLEFQRANGINATIVGYEPKCRGCVVFGKDPLYVHGYLHLPKDKWHLMNRKALAQPTFVLLICAFDFSFTSNYDCKDYSDFDSWDPVTITLCFV